jgi:DNA-binding protein Fis
MLENGILGFLVQAHLLRRSSRCATTTNRGNHFCAAQLLGINRNTLRKRLDDLAIDPEGFVRRG